MRKIKQGVRKEGLDDSKENDRSKASQTEKKKKGD